MILTFFSEKDITALGALNKNFYNDLVPQALAKVRYLNLTTWLKVTTYIDLAFGEMDSPEAQRVLEFHQKAP